MLFSDSYFIDVHIITHDTFAASYESAPGAVTFIWQKAGNGVGLIFGGLYVCVGGGGGIGCGDLYVLFLVATDMYIEVGGGGVGLYESRNKAASHQLGA